MGFSRSQCEAWGIGHLYPTESRSLPSEVVPPVVSAAPQDDMNKLEREFWGRLQEAKAARYFGAVYREPITLRLAGRTTYRPDFLGVQFGLLHFYEVKGFMRDDASVKFKVAADLYPFFRFILVTRSRRVWECRDVTSRGIARQPYCPDWLL